MHHAYLGIRPGPDGDEWFVLCDTCARGSRACPDRSATRDLLAAHLLDAVAWPVHGVDPREFTPPAEITDGPPRWL